MQIRRLRHETGSYGIVGQVINVPVDVNNMVQQLPRQLDDDYTFNVNIKKHTIHKTSYLSGFVKKATVKSWLNYLINTPLYKHFNITINPAALNEGNWQRHTDEGNFSQNDLDILEKIEHNNDAELLIGHQHTMIWNEDQCLDIAPGMNQQPLSIIYDDYAEELSFPAIYLGRARVFRQGVRVTPFMVATSEVRRRDRRGVTPQHILYMAMKILRLRVTEGLYNTFKCQGLTANITRKMIEDRQFLEECVEKNLSFLKSIPNSVQYWAQRKKDLFAMIRQLGKPTMFLTLSANEIRWPHLLRTLHRLKTCIGADHWKMTYWIRCNN